MFPVRLRRPAVIALCATEFVLGAALLLTAGGAGAGNPAAAARAAAVLLFGTGRPRSMSCERASPMRAAAASAS